MYLEGNYTYIKTYASITFKILQINIKQRELLFNLVLIININPSPILFKKIKYPYSIIVHSM